MFLRRYTNLRLIPEEQITKENKKVSLQVYYEKQALKTLAQLGPYAFEEISGEVVQSVMFVLLNHIPNEEHSIVAFRWIRLKSAQKKKEYLIRGQGKYSQKNTNLIRLPGSPMGYWLSHSFLKVINNGLNIKNGARTRAGLTTSESKRYYRKHWELKNLDGWLAIANGGSFKKWAGHILDYLRWGEGWITILSETGNRLPSLEYYTESGVYLK
jgi:hypothetical protein